MKKDLLLILIIIGAAVGFLLGALINAPVNEIKDPEKRKTTIMLIGFPGELLMSMLQMVILPLIIASLITALAALDSTASGKVGRRAMLFYLTTTLCAAVLGMALVAIIQPGKSDKPDGEKTKSTPYRILDSFLDLIR
jgi:Na+/H+-dicarboxylate symporter